MSGYIAVPEQWTQVSDPGAAAQPSASKAAAKSGFVHFCTGISVSLAAGATAQTPIRAYLRDSTTGAGNVLWAGTLGAPANGSSEIHVTGINIRGTKAQAMTLELEAATAANVIATATLMGYTKEA